MNVPDVVITGIGVVSPIGVGLEAFARSLSEGKSGVRLLEEFAGDDSPVHIAAPIDDFDAKRYVRPRKSLKIMSRDLQLGVAAAILAGEQAGLEPGMIDPERLGVVFGAEVIQLDPQELAASFRACVENGRFDFSLWGQRALPEFHPLWMLKFLPNMTACHAGIALDAQGPNDTITLGDVSGLLAMIEAATLIERGWADAVLAGGVMSRVHPAHFIRSFNSQQSPERDNPQAASRPFDLKRNGLVNGEAAAALVLEPRDKALARGATPLAKIAGWSSTFEPCPPGRERTGEAIRRSIVESLRMAGLSPRDIGHVNAHGLSTTDNDRLEAWSIWETLGDTPVTALKSYFGAAGPGGAVLELAASLHSFHTGEVPPSLNYDFPDPDCPVNVLRSPLRGASPIALKLSQNPTGQAAALVISGP